MLPVVLAAASPADAKELVVTAESTTLLGRCGDDGNPVAELPRGSAVRLRFALAGADARCYSVSSEVDGRRVAGYVAKADVAGLEQLEEELRNSAAAVGAPGAGGSPRRPVRVAPTVEPKLQTTGRSAGLIEALRRGLESNRARTPNETLRILEEAEAPAADRDVSVLRGDAYLQLSRPTEALRAMEAALRDNPKDPDLLGLSGYAYLLQDDPRRAEKLLEASLAARHTPSFATVLKQVRREAAAQSTEGQAYGSRFQIRFEGDALPDDVVRRLVKDFEGELNRIQFRLGCPFTDRLPIIVRTLESYRKSSAVAQWSGGHFDGRIHIAVPPSGEADAYVRETFSHELVHACLARKGRYPVWVHEGLAELMSGRVLSIEGRALLSQMAAEDALPSMQQLAGSWVRLGTREASVAYGLSTLAAETMYEDHGDAGVRSLLNSPSRLDQEASRLDKRLAEKLRSR